MQSPVVAALVGVANPGRFTYRGAEYRFRSLNGVANDIAWYEQIIREHVVADLLTLQTYTSAADTTVTALRKQLTATIASLPPDSTFILVLVGHGFQAPDDNGDEWEDRLDELFAASDGPIVDDDFAEMWKVLPDSVRGVVVFTDTCSADTLTIRGGRNIEPIIAKTETGPSKLFISGSMEWEEAREIPTSRSGVRGVMTLALEDAWNEIPECRTSYLTWFREALQLLAVRRQQQHPRLRYFGPNQDLLTRAPFT